MLSVEKAHKMQVGNRECPIWLAYVAFSNKATAERGAYREEHYDKPVDAMLSVLEGKTRALREKLNEARAAYSRAISRDRSYRSWVFDNGGTPEEPPEKELVDQLEEELNAAWKEEEKLYPLYKAATDALWKLVEAKLKLMSAEKDAEWAAEEERLIAEHKA